MLIRVENIKEAGLFLTFQEKAESFPALEQMASEEEMRFTAPLQISLRAVRIQELIEVEGRVETVIRSACGRCLTEFESPLEIRFDLTYSRELPEASPESAEEEGVELSAEEMGLIPFQGEEIDLRAAIQEQVIMGLPIRPLCRENCQGLCPQCGADLNAGGCGCEPSVFLNRFAALKNFKAGRDQEE